MFECTSSVAMLVVADRIQSDHAGQRQRRRHLPARQWSVPRKKYRQNQASDQDDIQSRLDDEDDVPGIPLREKWPERTYSVIVGEVEEDMTQSCNVREDE